MYTHSLLDAHPTHTAAAWRVIQALRSLPADMLPEQVYGCEVWRGLEWLPRAGGWLLTARNTWNCKRTCSKSSTTQVESGKRYDRAILGRRAANATMNEPNTVDKARAVAFAMDLTPLVRDKTLSPRSYLLEILGDFEQEALSTLPDDA